MNTKYLLAIALMIVLSGTIHAQMIFEKSEYIQRREKLMDQIPEGIAVFTGAPLPVGVSQFFQYNNIMYFAGLEIPDVILIIDGVSRTSTLFFSITESGAKGEGISMELIKDPGRFTGIEKVLPYDQFTPVLTSLIKDSRTIYTLFKADELIGEVSSEKANSLRKSMTENQWDGRLTRELQFVNKIHEKFPEATVKDCSNIVSDLRKIKSKAEIEIMRDAGKIGVKAHLAFMKAVDINVKEKDLAARFQYTCKIEDAQEIAYTTIIMSGENMPYGHYNRYNRTFKDGDFIILDAGPSYKYYVVDISTSMPANGKFTPKQKELYELANGIREVCIKSFKPGITLGEVGQNVKKYLVVNNFNPEEARFSGLIRLGGYNHSIGMAVHDGMGTFQGTNEVLEEGFVFACDINMIYADIEIGIRLEDTVLITKDGCEILSAGLPRTVEEVERTMEK
ncbi:MAG: M24 family metallopeptidase [Bacteroidia bacterium]|nr:MAG: M24 family metallopeptidase [Bacteroidia bacterium]